jgi:hypothetical protein
MSSGLWVRENGLRTIFGEEDDDTVLKRLRSDPNSTEIIFDKTYGSMRVKRSRACRCAPRIILIGVEHSSCASHI